MSISKINKVIAVSAAVFLFAAVLSGCKSSQQTKANIPQEAKTVKAVQSTRGSIESKLQYSSKLKPVQEVSVAPKVAGRVDSTKAVVGQVVHKGDVLFTIDSREVQAQYNQAEASLASSNASLNRTKDSSYVETVNQYEVAIQQKQVAYDDAKNNYDKNKALYDQGVVTKQDMDTAETKLKTATIDLDSAKRVLDTYKSKSNPQAVDVAAAAVAQAQKSLDLYKTQLDNYTVVSPIDGVVSAKNVNEGEMSSSSTAAYTIISSDTLVAEVNVTDKTIAKINKGDKVQFSVDAVGDKKFEGVIDSISPNSDSKTQFYTIKINYDNKDGALKAGMFAKVYLTADKKDNVVLVDNSAIVTESGSPFVFTVVNNVIKKKSITIGLVGEKQTEVTSNLNEGEQVITEGQTFLSDGQKANIAK